MKKRSTTPIKAMGVVTPAKWDENDNIIGVSIQTLDEEEYIVELNEIGRELFAFIHHRVEARGLIRKRMDGKLMINVKSYEMIKSYNKGREAIN